MGKEKIRDIAYFLWLMIGQTGEERFGPFACGKPSQSVY
jgi:hypothetical protein